MKVIFTFFVTLLTVNSIGQKGIASVSASVVRSFFNDVRHIINGGKSYFYLCDKPSGSDFPNKKKELAENLKIFKMDSCFSKNDIDTLVKQIKQTEKIIWNSLYLDSTVFLRNSFLDSTFNSPNENVRKGQKLPVFYTLTFPLFSRDKQTCYISALYWCGRLCGQRFTYIFKLVNNHWETFRIFFGAVS